MSSLKDKITADCYSALPEFLNKVLSKTGCSGAEFQDICLAICLADELKGTNRQYLNKNYFFSASSDNIWKSIQSTIGVSLEYNGSELPRVQKMRLISDACSIVLELKVSGCNLSSPYNTEVAQVVVGKLKGGTTSHRVSHENADEDDVKQSILEMLKYVESSVDCENNFFSLLEYVASADNALDSVLSDDYLNNLGNIDILKRILYRDAYGELEFSNEFLETANISIGCKEFIRRNFRVTDETISISDLEVAFGKYIHYWKASFVYVTHMVLKFYFKVSPVFTTTRLKNLKENNLFPIGVAVTQQNTKITRDIEFDNSVLRKRFNDLCVNKEFTSDTILGLLTIISSVSSNYLIPESKLRGMLVNAELNN